MADRQEAREVLGIIQRRMQDAAARHAAFDTGKVTSTENGRPNVTIGGAQTESKSIPNARQDGNRGAQVGDEFLLLRLGGSGNSMARIGRSPFQDGPSYSYEHNLEQ
jgi:hypothetical protein